MAARGGSAPSSPVRRRDVDAWVAQLPHFRVHGSKRSPRRSSAASAIDDEMSGGAGLLCLRLPHGVLLVDHRHHLIQSFSPAVAESHLVVGFSACFVAVNGSGRILGFPALRLEQDDRSEGKSPAAFYPLSGTVAGQQGGGEHQLLVLDDLEITAEVVVLLSLRSAHDGAENSSRVQVDLALGGL